VDELFGLVRWAVRRDLRTMVWGRETIASGSRCGAPVNFRSLIPGLMSILDILDGSIPGEGCMCGHGT
jgi:hypothetical protein